MESQPVNYTHRPLCHEREIRTLHLYPGTGSSTVTCSIEHVSLDDQPYYEAVSYVWGQDNPVDHVECDGKKLYVTPNLYAALLRLRLPDKYRRLWIDQVTISQADEEEKSQQVNLMGDIFKYAARVLAWLGEVDDDMLTAFRFIPDCMLQVSQIRRKEGKTRIHNIRELLNILCGLYPPTSPEWKTVQTLLERSWLSRIWVVQETALARILLLLSGPFELNWFFFELMMVAVSHSSKTEYALPVTGANRVYKTLVRVRKQHESPALQQEFGEDILSMFYLLHTMRIHGSSDERDKVFAFLNVAHDAKLSGFEADYSMHWRDVYIMTARWLFSHHENLTFLGLVEVKLQMNYDQFPSWVPNFREKESELNTLYGPALLLREPSKRTYNSTGLAKTSTKPHGPSDYLELKGIYVGQIKSVSQPARN